MVINGGSDITNIFSNCLQKKNADYSLSSTDISSAESTETASSWIRRAVRMHTNTRAHVSVRKGRSSFEGRPPISNLIVIGGGVTCLPGCLEDRHGEQHGPTDDIIAPKLFIITETQLFIYPQLYCIEIMKANVCSMDYIR